MAELRNRLRTSSHVNSGFRLSWWQLRRPLTAAGLVATASLLVAIFAFGVSSLATQTQPPVDNLPLSLRPWADPATPAWALTAPVTATAGNLTVVINDAFVWGDKALIFVQVPTRQGPNAEFNCMGTGASLTQTGGTTVPLYPTGLGYLSSLDASIEMGLAMGLGPLGSGATVHLACLQEAGGPADVALTFREVTPERFGSGPVEQAGVALQPLTAYRLNTVGLYRVTAAWSTLALSASSAHLYLGSTEQDTWTVDTTYTLPAGPDRQVASYVFIRPLIDGHLADGITVSQVSYFTPVHTSFSIDLGPAPTLGVIQPADQRLDAGRLQFHLIGYGVDQNEYGDYLTLHFAPDPAVAMLNLVDEALLDAGTSLRPFSFTTPMAGYVEHRVYLGEPVTGTRRLRITTYSTSVPGSWPLAFNEGVGMREPAFRDDWSSTPTSRQAADGTWSDAAGNRAFFDALAQGDYVTRAFIEQAPAGAPRVVWVQPSYYIGYDLTLLEQPIAGGPGRLRQITCRAIERTGRDVFFTGCWGEMLKPAVGLYWLGVLP